MSRSFLIAPLLTTFASITVPAQAADAPPAAPAADQHYSSATTQLGTLLDDPASKAVVLKYFPNIMGNDHLQMARGMTLKQIQGFVGDKLPDETLAKIDADLAQLPPH